MIFTAENGQIKYCKNFKDAFSIEKKSVVSIIGAGGKTSLVFALADELLKTGTVFVTTSTHMYAENGIVLSGKSSDIIEKLNKDGFAFAGIMDGLTNGKIKSLDKTVLEKCINYADFTLIEADGAKNMKIKFPRENEPVIVPQTNKIILVMNIRAVGENIKKVCFNCGEYKKEVDTDTIVECIKKYKEKDIIFSVFINGIKNEKNKADFLKISSAFSDIRFVGADIVRRDYIGYKQDGV